MGENLRSWRCLLLLAVMACLTIVGSVEPAGPPLEEIRMVMLQRALQRPSLESLLALDPENLDAGLAAIDPYARYVPPCPSPRNSSPAPSLGIEMFLYKSRLWVRVDPGGPADQGGVPEIGELQAINNTKVSGEDFAGVSALLDLSAERDRVLLTISTHVGKEGKTYKVKPAKFRPSSFIWRRAGNNMVVRIKEFVAHSTAPNLSAWYHTLVRPESRVVVDLRGCSGGDLYEAIEIAGMFVSADLPLASTYGRSGTIQTYRAPPGPKLRSPTWLLIDRRTGSAAEVFAGILQYYRLTRLVGERSVGKFVSQTLIPLSDGGELWLTTLAVHFPNGMYRTGTGLEPDIPYHDIMVANALDIINKISNSKRTPK